MDPHRMRFVIGQLNDDELQALKRNEPVISKLLLVPDDYEVFHYKEGDEIEVETHEGNRVWTVIRNMEVVTVDERVIIIFTLVQKEVTE